MECNELIVFDNFKGTFSIIVNTKNKTLDGYQLAKKRITEIRNLLFSLQPSIKHNITKEDIEIPSKSNISYEVYEKQVKSIKNLIHSGEIMQPFFQKK